MGNSRVALGVALVGLVAAAGPAVGRTAKPHKTTTTTPSLGVIDDDAWTAGRAPSGGRDGAATEFAANAEVPRRVQLDVGAKGPKVRVVAFVDAPDAGHAADIDGDGWIGDSERSTLIDSLKARTFLHTTMVWDDRVLPIVDAAAVLVPTVGSLPPSGPFRLEATWSLSDPLGRGSRRVAFHDSPDKDDAIVPVSVFAPPGWTVHDAVAGRAESKGPGRWEFVSFRTAPLLWFELRPPQQ